MRREGEPEQNPEKHPQGRDPKRKSFWQIKLKVLAREAEDREGEQ